MPGDIGASDQNEIVRCNSCRAAISGIVSRCPYCGQRTTGSEQPISQLDLNTSARVKASERRLRNQCKVCGKAILPEETLCSNCEAKDRLKTRIILILLIAAAIFGVWYLYQDPLVP